ncbi:thymidylate synthase [Robertmurraya siralis]|uniref:thymidylate synthase n=1 Tax=Robertmurraya siralis TaxID=77777 RepID=UPI001476C761|nr:thymidylate synthase [Robertmurraya siralis]
MSRTDLIYNELVKEIHKEGVWDKGESVRTKYSDNSPAHTKSIIGRQVIFEAEDIPIITTKHVAWRSAIAEAWWIWFMRSNKVEDLRQLGSKVWNEWELSDGTIGKAYGFQLSKPVRKTEINIKYGEFGYSHRYKCKVNQVDYLIKQLKENKSSRRLVTSLWNIDDLDYMALEPCVWSQQWIVQDEKLNLIVNQRSADVALGVCFNWFQYKVIQSIIAKLTNLEVGRLVWNFGHLHYYDRHEEKLLEQIKGKTHNQPILALPSKEELEYYIYVENPCKDNLMKMFSLENYNHNGKFNYEVAI